MPYFPQKHGLQADHMKLLDMDAGGLSVSCERQAPAVCSYHEAFSLAPKHLRGRSSAKHLSHHRNAQSSKSML